MFLSLLWFDIKNRLIRLSSISYFIFFFPFLFYLQLLPEERLAQ